MTSSYTAYAGLNRLIQRLGPWNDRMSWAFRRRLTKSIIGDEARHMAIYAVTVDARGDVGPLRRALTEMESFHAYPGLWFVRSSSDTPTFTMDLAALLPESDRLFVCRLTERWVSIRTPDAAAWLNARGL